MLTKRAPLSYWSWVAIITASLTIPCLLFCIVAGIIIWRRKAAFAKRQALFNAEAEQRGLLARQRVEHEMWRGDLGRGVAVPIELQGGVNDGPVLLDGYEVPKGAEWNGRAVEMPGREVR